MRSIHLAVLLISFPLLAGAQQNMNSITLQACLQLLEQNYPLVSQAAVLDELTRESVARTNAIWQPQVALNAQATYQSDVVSVPVESPLFEIPELSKDQYKASLDVSQLLYDGGASHQQKTLQQMNGAIENEKVAVDIYKAKERVVQLYAAILLAKENLTLTNQVIDDLAARRQALQSGFANGVVSSNSLNLFDIEILKTKQKSAEISWQITENVLMLSKLTGAAISDETDFENPALESYFSDTVNLRPELNLFLLQSEYAKQQMDFASALTLPKISLFVQGGYGRPGLNYLLDEFDFYYMGGIRLNYPLWQGNARQYEENMYALQLQTIEIQKNTFLLGNSIQTIQQNAEMQKFRDLMQFDRDIIELREKTKSAAAVQLDNGAITATEYINEVNAGLEAEQSLAIHQSQFYTAEAFYLIQLGKL